MRDYVSHACVTTNERTMQVFDRLNSLVNLVVGAVNTIAGKAMFDAIERIKATPYFRQSVKFELNQAARLYYAYEKLHMTNFGDRKQLFYDYLDQAEADIQKHVNILRMSIKAMLDKYGQTETELKSYVETGRTLLDYACHIYDTQIEIANSRCPDVDFNKWMNPARLTGVLKHYENASDIICKTEGNVTIDLNKDKNVKLAFDIIQTKVTSEDFINRVGYEALELNPECRKYVNEEDYKELEERYVS